MSSTPTLSSVRCCCRILELAHEAQAACIVTGDKDLLDLHPYQGIAILTPRQFLDAPLSV
ncbi:MAG: hypothetical protein ABIJ53_07060 [Verrucomicrobiota bacterium]